MDTFDYYLIEIVVNIPIGFIFGNRIHNIIGFIILVLIAGVGISIIHQELSNFPATTNSSNSTNAQDYSSTFANNIAIIGNFATWALSFMPSLVVSGIGTSIGIAIRKAFT